MQRSSLRGIFPAIPTPVNADDTIDLGATKTLMAYLLKSGIDGVLPLGGTGEYVSLGREQRIRMAGATAEAAAGKVPVMAGVLDPGFHDALDAGKAYAKAGVDALLVLTPYYTNPTQAGIRDYFMRYADASPVPILVYDIPYRTRVVIDPEVLHELSRHPNIVGMKACNTDMYHFLRVMAGVAPDFAVFSGEDTLFPLHVAAGAKGGIVVTATALPRTWRRIHDLAVAGKTAEALRAHRELIPLMNMSFAETNPGPLKAVWDLIGVQAPRLLAPLVPAADALQARLRTELQRCLAAEAALA